MDQDDPADWSLDRVIQEICDIPPPIWQSDAGLKPIINPEGIAKAFRDNDIDGDNLLALEDQNLRSDLCLTSFGQRRGLNNIISYLRSLSTKHQLQLARSDTDMVSTPHLSRSSVIPHMRSPSLFGMGLQPSVEGTKRDEHQVTFSGSNGSITMPNQNQHKSAQTYPTEDQVKPRQSCSASHDVQTVSSNTTNAHARSKANLPVEPHGSYLHAIDSAINQELNNSNSVQNSGQDAAARPSPSNLQTLQNKARKRADLISITGTQNLQKNIAGQPYITDTLMPDIRPEGQTSHGVMRPPTKRAKWINVPYSDQEQVPILRGAAPCRPRTTRRRIDTLPPFPIGNVVKNLTSNPIDDSTEFEIIGHQPPTGRVRNSMILLQPSSELINTSKKISKDLLAASTKRHTAATSGHQVPVAVSNLPLQLTAEDMELLQRYPVKDVGTEFPLYGESDEEDRWTSGSEPTPPPPVSTAPEFFGRPEVDSIIDDCISQFRTEWANRYLANTQIKAYRKWMSAAKNRMLHGVILDECTRWQNKARNRLQNLRNGVHFTEWRKAEDIKIQCLALEVSVQELEKYNLYVSVLEDEHEPLLPKTKKVSQTREPRLHTVLPNGDEELDSDSGSSFVVKNDLRDIVDDSIVAIDQINPTWTPKFGKQSKTSLGGLIQPAEDHEMIIDTVENHSTPVQVPLTNTSNTPIINRQNEAVVTSNENDVSHSQQRSTFEVRQAALESAKRNPIILPHWSDSSDIDSDLDRHPRLPATQYRRIGRSPDNAIDLTTSSPASKSRRSDSITSIMSVRTPKLNPVDVFASNTVSSVQDSTHPGIALNSTSHPSKGQSQNLHVKHVQQIKWEDIEPLDRIEAGESSQMALAKAVYELSTRRARDLLDYLTSFQEDADLREVLTNGLDAEKEYDDIIQDVNKKNQDNARKLIRLCISYGTGCKVNDSFELSDKQADEVFYLISMRVGEFRGLLQSLLEAYVEYADRRLVTDNSSIGDVSDISESSLNKATDRVQKISPHKIRKRKVKQSKEALSHQRHDQYRVLQQEQQRALLLQQQSALGVDSGQLSVSISINQPIVYLDPKLAVKVKPHQVEGIRFMWREIIENSRQEGCLLAHTMGLGKTMQVISLLASIAQCNASDDPAMRQHIPQYLHKPKILILCPWALIENWYEELRLWLPDPMLLGVLIKLDSQAKQPESMIRGWFENGGVLIINYEKFRSFVFSSDSENADANGERGRYLLEGPDIVIADEAHKLKNAKSKINQAASLINTKCRIALTGSPLNNHLEEYHTMINWVSPGYLGNMVQFKVRYVEPISQGLYSQSSTWERKECRKRLHMLKRTIAPKINRADITAIKADLPPKTEFFLTITLTEEQTSAYKLYVATLRDASVNGVGKQSNTRVWSWLNVLSLLLSHPSCFIKKLQQKDANSASSSIHIRRTESDDEIDDNVVAENVVVAQQPELSDAMEKVMEIFAEAKVFLSMDDPSLSNKSLLIKLILEEAVALGEKTLIFSKSIPALDYYESMVREMGLAYKRIDGQRGSAAGGRQQEVAYFNASDSFKVFLISTRAGGLGLNIQSASRVIISDFDFNPTWEEQAVGRAYRIGQSKPVYVYRFLTGGTFEELIHNKAVFKTQLFTRVVDEKNVMSQAQRKPGEFLFDPTEVPQKNFDDCRGKDPDVLDRILQKVDCIRDIFLTETFFQDDNEKLNEQEIKEANEQLELERLEKDNPDEYQRRIREKQRDQMSVAQQILERQSSQSVPGANGFQALRHYLDVSVPSHPNPEFLFPMPTKMHARGNGSYPLYIRGAFDDAYTLPVPSSSQYSAGLFATKDDHSLPTTQIRSFNTQSQARQGQTSKKSSPYFSLSNKDHTTNDSTQSTEALENLESTNGSNLAGVTPRQVVEYTSNTPKPNSTATGINQAEDNVSGCRSQ